MGALVNMGEKEVAVMKQIFSAVLIMLFVFIPLQIPDNTTETQVAGVFTTTTVKQVQVTADTVNFRTGASTNHRIITTYSQGTVLDVIGKIDRWYVVKNSKDTVGCVSGNMVQPYNSATNPPNSGDSGFNAMQNEMLGYINADRQANGLKPLLLNQELCEGAYLKSKDMAVNNYFSHTSPTYGSPFEMMKSLGISYSAAGENIAINSTVRGAHDAFMNSSGHRANVLNPNFTEIGLGFHQEGRSLYVTQWFTD